MTKEQFLESLTESYQSCFACQIGKARRKLVVWRGNPEADIMLIGEGPGEDEDRMGLPFIGRAGKKLDELLELEKIQDRVVITNIVLCRPTTADRKNRAPEENEVVNCFPRLAMMLHILNPRVVVLLGSSAIKCFFGDRVGSVSELRKKGIFKIKEGISDLRLKHLSGRYVMGQNHPASYLYKEDDKLGREDFEKLRRFVNEVFPS